MLQVNVLGPVTVRRDDQDVPIVSMKQKLLVSRLAIAPTRSATTDQLVDDLWGDNPPRAALNSIQVSVSALRTLLGAESIETHGRSYLLSADVSIDAESFRAEVVQGMAAFDEGDLVVSKAWIGRALARWQGDPLADLDPVDFVQLTRDELEGLSLEALETWASISIREGRSAQVVARLAPVVALHPFRETLRAHYIRALAGAGRSADALAEFEDVRRILSDEFGTDPGPALRNAHSAVLREEVPVVAVPRGARLTLGLRETPRRIIGREREVEAISGLVAEPGMRLVSLLGPGGVGKTRLLQEIVMTSPIDAGFVFLGSTDSAELFFDTVCSYLGLDAGVDPEESLVAALVSHAHPLLLALDNLEHLPHAVPLIERLLGRVSDLRVVATSRVALDSRGEYRYSVGALEIESSGNQPSAADELVFETIRSKDATFRPTDADRSDARAISLACAGFPLAIELVAARSTSSDLAELRSRLTGTDTETAPESAAAEGGPASLARTIRWSVDALSAQSRMVLIAAATFRGGFSAAGVAAVADVSPESATELLHILREYGLVTASNVPSGRRFDVLPVITEILAEAHPADFRRFREAHAIYFAGLTRPSHGKTFPRSQAHLRMVALEAANFRVAVRTLREIDMSLCGELVVALGVPWMRVGTPAELQEWIDDLLGSESIGNASKLDLMVHLLRIDATRATSNATAIVEAARSVSGPDVDAGRRARLASFEGLHAADIFDVETTRNCLDFVMQFPVDLEDEVLTYAQSLCRLAMYSVVEDEEAAANELRTFLAWAKPRGLELHIVSASQNLMQSLLILGQYDEAADLALDQLGTGNEYDLTARMVSLHLYSAALIHLGNPALAIEILESVMQLTAQQGWVRLGYHVLAALAVARLAIDPEDRDAAAFVGIYRSWMLVAGLQLDGIEVDLFASVNIPAMEFEDGSPQARLAERGEALLSKLGAVETHSAIVDALSRREPLIDS